MCVSVYSQSNKCREVWRVISLTCACMQQQQEVWVRVLPFSSLAALIGTCEVHGDHCPPSWDEMDAALFNPLPPRQDLFVCSIG